MDFNNQRQNSNRVIWAILIALLIMIGSLFFYFYTFYGSLSLLHDNWGYFGDYVGGVTGTLVAALAVFLIYLTYRLQQEELEKTNVALTTQNEQLKIQQFQNVFFNLLERKDQIVNEIEMVEYTVTIEGSDQREKVKGIAAIRIMNDRFRNKEQDLNREEALKIYWGGNKGQLTPYFNSFLSTVDFLNSFKSNNERQHEIRAQLIKLYSSNLSTYEKTALNLIFEYHRAHEPDNEEINKCRSYVEIKGILQ